LATIIESALKKEGVVSSGKTPGDEKSDSLVDGHAGSEVVSRREDILELGERDTVLKVVRSRRLSTEELGELGID
jgi:hypothetical protein